MSESRPVHTWLTDMDGVLVHEEDPIPGAAEFIEALERSGLKYLLITNNSIFTRRDLRARLLGSGIDVPEDAIWTSALATAQFLTDQPQSSPADADQVLLGDGCPVHPAAVDERAVVAAQVDDLVPPTAGVPQLRVLP